MLRRHFDFLVVVDGPRTTKLRKIKYLIVSHSQHSNTLTFGLQVEFNTVILTVNLEFQKNGGNPLNSYRIGHGFNVYTPPYDSGLGWRPGVNVVCIICSKFARNTG